MSHRFNVNFSEGAYRDLSTLAKRKDTTMSESSCAMRSRWSAGLKKPDEKVARSSSSRRMGAFARSFRVTDVDMRSHR